MANHVFRREPMNLVIIGNGFDLRCGLHSSFSDFFKTSELSIIDKWFSKNFKSPVNDINLISLIVYNCTILTDYRVRFDDIDRIIRNPSSVFRKSFNIKNEIENWADVESIIKFLAVDLLKVFKDTFEFSYAQPYCKGKFLLDQDGVSEFVYGTYNSKYFDKNMTYLEFLEAEIKDFERRFREYLYKEIHENVEYSKKSQKLLKHLSSRFTKILNFNYTSLEIEDFSSHVFNIHGSIDENNIIIGFDDFNASKHNTLIETYSLTKTFRKLSSEIGKITLLDNVINTIVIYGHSLNEHDYSYFQSIFDYCELYSSKTKIIFIYSDYFIDGKSEKDRTHKKEQHKHNMNSAFYKLLKKYGESFVNKDNGKNLLHKLLLEGRIQVKKDNFESVIPL